MAITTVIFDVGRVLYDWSPRYLYEKLIPDPARLNWFLAHVVTSDWHFQHDAGRAFADTSAERIAAFPAEAALIRAFGPRFNETLPGMVPGMASIVAELTAREVPLYAITNFSAEFWPPFRTREEALFQGFRGIVVSGVEKLAKPDTALFRLAIRRFGVDPASCLFIDDREDNCAAARAERMEAHHFTSAEALVPVLEAAELIPGF